MGTRRNHRDESGLLLHDNARLTMLSITVSPQRFYPKLAVII